MVTDKFSGIGVMGGLAFEGRGNAFKIGAVAFGCDSTGSGRGGGRVGIGGNLAARAGGRTGPV